MDAAEVLPKLKERGFTFRTFERYPRSMGAVRDNFVALLEATPEDGLRLSGASGYLIGERIAVLVTGERGSVFRSKEEEIPASPELLSAYRRFQEDLNQITR